MSKKIITIILVVLSVVFLICGGAYVLESGVFKPFPEAEYLTDIEEDERLLYGKLSKKEKAVYTALYRGICEKKTEIELPYDISGETYSKLYCLIEKQEPELFYIDSTYYTAHKIRTAVIVMREKSEASIREKEDKLSEIINKIVSRAKKESDDFGKALYIHDYIVANCRYDLEDKTGYNSTAYGCLVEGVANCEGYAKAFSLLARAVGLDAFLVTGITDDGENHAWNKVNIDYNWYNLDVTWDDTDDSNDRRHFYFLCEDEMYSKTHFDSGEYGGELRCKSKRDNFYHRKDLHISDMNDAERILAREISKNNSFIELRFSDSEIYNQFKNEYFANEGIFNLIMNCSSNLLIHTEDINVITKENEKEKCILIWIE